MEGQIKNISDKKILKEFIITKPVLYDVLKGLLEGEEEQQKYEQ